MKRVCAILLTFVLALAAVGCVEKAPPAASSASDGGALTAAEGTARQEPLNLEDFEVYDAYVANLDILDQNAAVFGDRVLELADTDGNWVYSPLSAWLCYELFLGGTTGDVEAALQEALESVPFADEKTKLETIRTLIDTYKREDSATRIENYLLIRGELNFKDDYLAYAGYFDGGLYKMNLPEDPEGVTRAINELIAERTFEIIPEFYTEPLDEETVSVLLNIIALDVLWQEPFEPADTQPETFTLADGTKIDVDMMRQTLTKDMLYYKDAFGEYVLKPYATQEHMVLLLPAADKTPAEILEHYLENKQSIGQELMPFEVTLALPKFSMQSDYPLADLLDMMGLGLIFDPANDRDMMNFIDNLPLYVSDSKQVAKIEVFEEGTRAAAVTSIDMEPTTFFETEKVTVEFNRPFAFTIADRDVELFRGVVQNPAED